jgi:hypothetical protein
MPLPFGKKRYLRIKIDRQIKYGVTVVKLSPFSLRKIVF